MGDDDDWRFSKHALERALDMAIPAKELRDTLRHPRIELPSTNVEHVVHKANGRINLVCDTVTRTVITILWDRSQGVSPGMGYARLLDEDLKRIREC